MLKYFLKSLRISDLILVIICLTAAILIYRNSLSDAKVVHIIKNDEPIGIYALDKSRTIIIDEHNSVEISEGKARMLFSDCPDKRCVKQGFNQNMPIICLPNHVVLEFKSSKEERKLILQ